MRKHLDLLVNLSTKTLSNVIPDITFPPKIFFRDQNSELIGYFVNYDRTIDSSNLLSEFKKDNGISLVNSNSHFLLLYLDGKENTLEIFIDQVGTFPLHYANNNKEVFCSTKFHNVLNFLKFSKENVSIDPDGLMTSLLWDSYPTEKTFISQIKKLPAGSKIKFDLRNLAMNKIVSLVDLDSFLANKEQPYQSIQEFTKDWINEVGKIVQDQLRTVNNLKFGCDLSSGFDCTLVAYSLKRSTNKNFTCYSCFSKYTQKETSVKKMINFAEKHDLDLKMTDVGEYFQFKHEMLSRLNPEDPYQDNVTYAYAFISKIAKEGIKVKFTGEGGDEIYGSRNLDKMAKFTIQQSYFNNIRYLKKNNVENLFKKNFVDFSLSRNRFNQRKLYPLIIPSTSGVIYWTWGEKIWENDLWILTPFVDTRLVALARRIPGNIKGGMNEIKQNILRQAPEIFDIEMFQKKEGLESIYVNFIYNQRKLIDTVLNNSILDRLGVINKEHLYHLLNNEKSILYSDELAISFYNIILMDWYFQANNINTLQN